MKKRPRVKIARSFAFDSTLYKVVEGTGGQGVSISSLERGRPVRIPLEGEGRNAGNIRVVLLPESRRIELHIALAAKPSADDLYFAPRAFARSSVLFSSPQM